MTSADSDLILIAAAAVVELGPERVRLRVSAWETRVEIDHELILTTQTGEAVGSTTDTSKSTRTDETMERLRRVDQRTGYALSAALRRGGVERLAREIRSPALFGVDVWR